MAQKKQKRTSTKSVSSMNKTLQGLVMHFKKTTEDYKRLAQSVVQGARLQKQADTRAKEAKRIEDIKKKIHHA